MFLSISKYYNSHITVTSNHERYISYIGSNNFVSMSKNKGYYFSSTHSTNAFSNACTNAKTNTFVNA